MLKNKTTPVRGRVTRIKRATLTLSLALFSASNANADVMLGASLPNDGFSRYVINEFNQQSQKNLAFVNVYSAFSHDWDNLYWQSSNVVAEGAMPMISWMPIDLNRREDNLLPEIAIGLWDDYLDLWGEQLLAWVNSYPESEKPRLSIRFAHEFNGNWYPYSNTPTYYQQAWTHIYDKFESMGVNDHVDWVWSISKTSYDDYDNVSVYYPGDNYVDWTAIDGYNWGSNYNPNGWLSFTEIMIGAYSDMVSNFPAKPIMISETASAEPFDMPNPDYGMYGDDSDAFESKSVWIGDMLTDLEIQFPAVRALAMFNINKELNWSLNQPVNTGMDTWIAGIQSEHYTTAYLTASNLDYGTKPPSKGKGKTKNKKRTQTSLSADTTYESFSYALPETRQISKKEQLGLVSTGIRPQSQDSKRQNNSLSLDKLSPNKQAAFNRAKLAIVDY